MQTLDQTRVIRENHQRQQGIRSPVLVRLLDETQKAVSPQPPQHTVEVRTQPERPRPFAYD